MTIAKVYDPHRSMIYKVLSVLLFLLFVISAAMTGTFAWMDSKQHKTNEWSGIYQWKDIGLINEDNDLTLTKTVVNANGSPLTDEQKEREFEFTVTFYVDDGPLEADNLSVFMCSIEDGPKQEIKSGDKILLKHGQKAVIKDLPILKLYAIEETPAAGYTTTSVNSSGNIPSGGITAVFINTHIEAEIKTGKLTVTKEVKNMDDSMLTQEQKDKEFAFTAFIDQTEHKFTLKHGEQKVFENLSSGTSYVIAENDYTADFYTALVTQYSGTIKDSTPVTLPFVNVHDSEQEAGNGCLVVSKAVVDQYGNQLTYDKDDTFNFTAAFSNLPESDTITIQINGEPEDLLSHNQFDFTLKQNETIRFTDIPNGVIYTVTEKETEGYSSDFTSADGTISSDIVADIAFINTYEETQNTKVTVRKIVEGNIPKRDENKLFNFILTVNGIPEEFVLKANETKEFTALPGDDYSLIELDYTKDGYVQAAVSNGSGVIGMTDIVITKTNMYTGNVKVTIEGEKTWDLTGAPRETALPDSITVQLKDGNTVVQTTAVKPDENGKWLYTFNAPKYHADDETEIQYTVEELPMNGWNFQVDKYNIKNTWTEPDLTKVTVHKVWEDAGSKTRPKNVTVQLYKNGEKFMDAIVLDDKNQWAYTWDNLEIDQTWTVDEIDVPEGYTKTVTGSASAGFIITNSKKTENDKITISGIKTWNHGNLDPKYYPGLITVIVKANDRIIIQRDITSDNNWRWSFQLDKYDSTGKEINYTIDEKDVPDYQKEIKGYDIINSYNPQIPDTTDKINPSGTSGTEPGASSTTEPGVSSGTEPGASSGTEPGASSGTWQETTPGNQQLNTPPNNAKTGDSSQLWLWVTLMIISLLGLTGIFVANRKISNRYIPKYAAKKKFLWFK